MTASVDDEHEALLQFLYIAPIGLLQARHGGEIVMVVLSDVTQSLKHDRALRQSQPWLNALVSGQTDYSLVPLDSRGQMQDWSASISRVTGFESKAVTNGSRFWGNGLIAPLHTPDDTDPERRAHSLILRDVSERR